MRSHIVRALSKQFSCSGVRRNLLHDRRSGRFGCSRPAAESDRFSTVSQQRTHRRCTNPPDDASPRHRESACPGTSPKPETDHPAASDHDRSRSHRRAERAGDPGGRPPSSNKLRRHARDDVQRVDADGPGSVSPPNNAGSKHRCSGDTCTQRPDLSLTVLAVLPPPACLFTETSTHNPRRQPPRTSRCDTGPPGDRNPRLNRSLSRDPRRLPDKDVRTVSGASARRGGAEHTGRDRRCLHPRRFPGRSPSSKRNARVFDAV